MHTTYDPKDIERECYQQWTNADYFKPTGKGEAYCVMLPPPNVTGSLHMGHGFQQTLMDILIRYHRMLGENVLWQGGTDHAGIATQMVVERQLEAQNISRHDLGRETFIDRVWQWKEKSGGQITQQMRRLGLSIDWTRERFTMDEQLSAAVLKAFVDLYEKGLIYRGKRLVNWDPVLLTAVSDLEVENTEEQGSLWHIQYPLADQSASVTVATTRPETMLGDVAVAVHPDDERYQKLIGKQIKLPLTDRLIPIIADDSVDLNFGTGCVKITPAHDFNDYAMGQRHKLPQINIFTPDAKINENAPEAYRGLDRFKARKLILENLKNLNLLIKTEPHTLSIPRGDRSQAVLEPYLTNQWYVNMQDMATRAMDVVNEKKLKFVPENWQNTYFHWLENIQDWCISRQLWWGHQIPAWYDEQENIYVGMDENDVRKKYKLATSVKLHQEQDVLDTWFSSALWPFSTLGWPEKTKELKTFYPTNVLVTGFDIIFFWVARMVMFGLKFTDHVPFHEVYITGLIRDAEGKKMSKTKGNVLDPLDIIDGIDLESLVKKRTSGLMQPQMAKKIENATRKEFPEGIAPFGTDALRFTYCALASTGRDIRFDLARVGGYRNFCNKLWNAARFVWLQTNEHAITKAKKFTDIDRYILTRLQQTIKSCHEYLADYRFDLLAQCLYEFTWNEYCDWYLELAKPLLAEQDTAPATRWTLVYVLENLLRLLHPIVPFITEEVWQKFKTALNIDTASIMISQYPEFNKSECDLSAVTEIEWLKTLITTIRTLRSQKNIPPSKQLSVLLTDTKKADEELLTKYKKFICSLCRLTDIQITAAKDLPPAISGLANTMQVFIPMAEFLDKDAEIARLKREMEKINIDLQKTETKLGNPSYVEKAPPAVVEKEKQKMAELKLALQQLNEQMQKINNLF